MSSVFHYTDTAGLLGIVSSETLHATDYRYLNDSTEAGMIRKYIMPIFEAEIATVAEKLFSAGLLDDHYYKEMGSRGSQIEAENQYRAFVRGVDNVSPFFVVSFCRHEDTKYEYQHGLLSQWRGYADSGGFAIEFDEKRLDEFAVNEQRRFAYAGFKSDDVEYFDPGKVFNAKDYEGVAGSMIWSIFDSVGKDISRITGRKNLDKVVLEFAKTAPFLKHESFHEEGEYRLVFVCIRKRKVPEEETRQTKSICFRQRSGLVVPFIELFEQENVLTAVRSIIVRPHPLQDKQEEAVNMLLEKEGLNVPVRKSEIPFRR
jgi:Protein of unknown function (DUF2971)